LPFEVIELLTLGPCELFGVQCIFCFYDIYDGFTSEVVLRGKTDTVGAVTTGGFKKKLFESFACKLCVSNGEILPQC
jgi:hypothetical protein